MKKKDVHPDITGLFYLKYINICSSVSYINNRSVHTDTTGLCVSEDDSLFSNTDCRPTVTPNNPHEATFQEEFHIPQTHFYHYLQIRSYFNSTPHYKSSKKWNILENKTTINIKHSWEKVVQTHGFVQSADKLHETQYYR